MAIRRPRTPGPPDDTGGGGGAGGGRPPKDDPDPPKPPRGDPPKPPWGGDPRRYPIGGFHGSGLPIITPDYPKGGRNTIDHPTRVHEFYPVKHIDPGPDNKEITPVPKQPPPPPPTYTNRELTNNAKGECYPVIYGTQRVGGRVVFYKTDAGQTQLYVDILVCEGPVQAIRDIRFGDYTPESLGMILNTNYHIYLGTADQTLDPLCSSIEPLYVSAKPGTAHVTFKFDGNNFSQQKVDIYSFKCTVDGLLIRDMRTDPNLVERYFRKNNALATLDFLTDTRYGAGFPDDQFDWIVGDLTESWHDAADDCDYVIAIPGTGPTQAPTVVDGSPPGPHFIGYTASYAYSFVINGVETLVSPATTYSPSANYVPAVLSNIAIGSDPGTSQRRIYRTKFQSPSDTTKYLVGIINDNSTTTFTDSIADAQLQPTAAPGSGSPCRYQLCIAMQDQKSLSEWLQILRATYSANFNYDGKYHVWIDKARSASGITFDRTNIQGDIEISTLGLTRKWAKTHANFVNMDCGFKDDEASVEVPTLAQPPTENEREERRVGEYDFTGVPSYDQTVRLLRQILNRSRLTRQIRFVAMYRGLQILPGQIISVSHDTGPLVNAQIIVTGLSVQADGLISITGEFYDVNVYSDTVQVNPTPIVPPTPGPGQTPANPTDVDAAEVLTAGPRGESISKIKVSWTPAPTPYAPRYRIKCENGIDTFTVQEVAAGPIYIENPRLGVLHTVTVYTIGTAGQLSTGASDTITPAGPAAPSAVAGLLDDSLKVLRLAASSARKYVWDFFLRVIWDPHASADVKQYRLRYSNVLTDDWAAMGATREMVIPANAIEQIHARPSDIAGLKLWLKADSLTVGGQELADGAPVDSWPDSSGYSNNATASGSYRPIFKTGIIGGRPVVRFDGTDDRLDCGNTPGIPSTHGWSYFAVVQPVSVATAGASGLYAIDRTTGTNAIVSLLEPANTAHYGMQVRDDAVTAMIEIDSAVDCTAGVPKIISMHRNPGSHFELYVDGVFKGDYDDAFTNLTPPAPRLGLRAGDVYGVNWDIAEVIIFDGYLSASNRLAIDAYLMEKYGFSATAPPEVGAPSRNIVRADLKPFISHDREELWELGVGTDVDTLIASEDNFYAYNVLVRAENYNGLLGTAAQIKQPASTTNYSTTKPPAYVPQSAVSKTLSNGQNDDVAAPAERNVFVVSGPTADFSVTGLTLGSSGRMVYLFNSTTYNMTLKNETGSAAGNRIVTMTGGDVVLGGKSVALLMYDSVSTRWILHAGSDTLGGWTQRGVNAQFFTSGGSFTVPLGVTKVYLTGCGAGGGGGDHASSGLAVGGGGGGGDAVIRKDVTVTPGQSYTITTGTGGNGGSGGNNGSAGGSTSFGALLTLSGGSGGYVGSGSPPGGNGNGGASGGPGGSYGGKSADSTGNFAGSGGGTIVSVAQAFHGGTAQSPFGAGGVGGYGSANGTQGGNGFLYVEW